MSDVLIMLHESHIKQQQISISIADCPFLPESVLSRICSQTGRESVDHEAVLRTLNPYYIFREDLMMQCIRHSL